MQTRGARGCIPIMAGPELATAAGGHYSPAKLKKSSRQSRKPRLQDNAREQTERTLRQHARPPAVAAIGPSPPPRPAIRQAAAFSAAGSRPGLTTGVTARARP